MDVVLDTSCLEVFHAGRGTSHHEHGASVEILECRNSVFCILVVGRADYNDVGTSLESCVNTFLHCGKAEIVNHLVAGASQEVARELGTCLTHSQITDGEHERSWNLGLLCMDAQVFEVGSQTSAFELLVRSLAGVATVAAASLVDGFLAFALLCEVGELVRAEDELFALGSVAMTLHVGSVDVVLYGAFLECLKETAFFLYLEENLPAFTAARKPPSSSTFRNIFQAS